MTRTMLDFVNSRPPSAQIYAEIARTVAQLPNTEIRPQKSQIGFYLRGHPFAAVWAAEHYLRRPGAPLVLTVFCHERIPSRRWKAVVQPVPGHFSHHLELTEPSDVDLEVRGILRRAWKNAHRPIAPGQSSVAKN